MLLRSSSDPVDRNVTRRRIVLEAVEQHPAIHVGQPEIERDRVGLDRACELESWLPRRRYDALEAALPRDLQQCLREREVVLDEEQHAVAGLERVVVIRDRARQDRWRLDRLDDR